MRSRVSPSDRTRAACPPAGGGHNSAPLCGCQQRGAERARDLRGALCGHGRRRRGVSAQGRGAAHRAVRAPLLSDSCRYFTGISRRALSDDQGRGEELLEWPGRLHASEWRGLRAGMWPCCWTRSGALPASCATRQEQLRLTAQLVAMMDKHDSQELRRMELACCQWPVPRSTLVIDRLITAWFSG